MQKAVRLRFGFKKERFMILSKWKKAPVLVSFFCEDWYFPASPVRMSWLFGRQLKFSSVTCPNELAIRTAIEIFERNLSE
jgi:hypothetical protein